MTSVQLHHGDCLDIMPTLPAGSVQMVFADLPYGLPSTSMKWDVPLCLEGLWEAWLRLKSKHAPVVLCGTQPFSSLLVASRPKLFRYALVWRKNVATNFFNALTQPLRSHEDLLVFGAAGDVYNPQKVFGSKPYCSKKKDDRSEHFNAAKRKPRISVNTDGSRYPQTVIEFDVVSSKKRSHPTEKPVALLEWLIKTYTNEGDTVLDPVMGSGSTGQACINTGRKFIGIEKDRTYFKLAEKRIADAIAQKRVAS